MLVRHIVGAGVTSLGKANYADKTGEYYTAFFGLSIGLERLSKLILVANYAICNHGKMPDDKYVRGYGHKLIKLLDVVDKISQKRGAACKTLIDSERRKSTQASSDVGARQLARF